MPFSNATLTVYRLHGSYIASCPDQTDEGTAFGLRNINTTDELVDSLALNYVELSRNSTQALVSKYSTEQAQGCPYNTGDGVLPTGLQDKVSSVPISRLFISSSGLV
jgi:hypothetical protein